MALSVSLAHAEYYRPRPVENDFFIRGQFDYYQTSANYPKGGGSSQGLPYNMRFSRLYLTGEAGYSFSKELRVWGGINGGQSTANVINYSQSGGSLVVTDTHTNSGINEGWLGAQYWVNLEGIDIVPQGQFTYPFWRVDRNSRDPLLGEGAMEVRPGVWVQMAFGNFLPFAYGGFDYRDEGRSGLFEYDLGTRYTGSSKKWWLQFDFRGFEAVTDDSASSLLDQNLRTVYLTNTNGTSSDLYAINPGRGEIAFGGGWQPGRIGIYSGGWMSVYGHNSSDAWGFKAGFTWNSESFKRKKRPSYQFSEPADRYDEKAFEEPVTPPPPSYTEPIDEPAAPSAQRPKPAAPSMQTRKQRRADEPMPDVESLMKDTQKSLEKRGN